MPIWSPKAIDYSKGFTIVDYLTNKVYTEQEAYNQPQDIKSRLVNRPNKVGCYVDTIEELRDQGHIK